MRTFWTTVSTLALVLAQISAGHAAVLWTAPARAAYPSFAGRTLFCDIRNVGPKAGTVTIEIFDYPGNIVTTVGPITLPANSGTAVSDGGTGNGVSCKFTVSGSAKRWRGVAMYDNGTDYTAAIPAQ